MSDLNRIEQNNAELRECIEIAESLPDAPKTSYTLQDFVDSRGLISLYEGCDHITDADITWLKSVDTSKCTSISAMFQECIKLTTIELNSTESVTAAATAFYKCYALEKVVGLNTSLVRDHTSMFYNCKVLKELPTIDFQNSTSGRMTFQYCAELENINVINTDKVTDATSMFSGCKKLKSVSGLNFNSLSSMEYMFSECQLLETVDVTWNIKNAKQMGGIFNNCKCLTSFPKLDTASATTVSNLFYQCELLTTISDIDMRNATSASSAFYGCKALTNLTLKNIKINLQVGSGTSWGHLLTVDCLVNACYELRDTGSVKTLTIGSANLEKLASVYVRSIEITDAMRAEDDLIDEKLPFERCESTDEGATLIADYVLLKNWKLA